MFFTFNRLIILLVIPLCSTTTAASPESSAQEISLSQALQLAVAADPRLSLNTTLAEAAEGQVAQAEVYPNPTVGIEIENFLGTGPVSGVEALEITFGIRQVIERSKKRAQRAALALSQRAVIDWDREIILADIEAAVRTAFIDVLLAQELLLLRTEQLDLAERSVEETTRLAEAARSSEADLARARLALQQQRFALQDTERMLRTARSILASHWEESIEDPRFRVVGEISLNSPPPDFSQLVDQLTQTAGYRRYEAETEVHEAALALERTRAKPDVELFAGARYFNDAGGSAGFLVGIEVPWPLFDKNSGNIQTAQAQLRSIQDQQAVTNRERRMALHRAYQQALNAHEEARSITTILQPAAETALTTVEDGYNRGQFDLLSVLEARRSLFEVREAYLDCLRRYATAIAQLASLTRPVSASL